MNVAAVNCFPDRQVIRLSQGMRQHQGDQFICRSGPFSGLFDGRENFEIDAVDQSIDQVGTAPKLRAADAEGDRLLRRNLCRSKSDFKRFRNSVGKATAAQAKTAGKQLLQSVQFVLLVGRPLCLCCQLLSALQHGRELCRIGAPKEGAPALGDTPHILGRSCVQVVGETGNECAVARAVQIA